MCDTIEFWISTKRNAVKKMIKSVDNRATIGGNIANASPSADTIPSLMALNASLRISDGANQRSSTLEDFLLGPGQTALRDGEILTAVVIPPTDARLRGEFIKLSPRQVMDLAVVGVAVTLVTDERSRVEAAAIALGAVAPIPSITSNVICGAISQYSSFASHVAT